MIPGTEWVSYFLTSALSQVVNSKTRPNVHGLLLVPSWEGAAFFLHIPADLEIFVDLSVDLVFYRSL
jgi:hypothetical protein